MFGVLALCLNLGGEPPPDVERPPNYTTTVCWFDPSTLTKTKSSSLVGASLNQQYRRWSKNTFKGIYCLDPCSDDVKSKCVEVRAKSEKNIALFHYNGHGVPGPSKDGDLWVFGQSMKFYFPIAFTNIYRWLGTPSLYVIDCSAAARIIPFLVNYIQNTKSEKVNSSMKNTNETVDKNISRSTKEKTDQDNTSTSSAFGVLVFAACKADEQLPMHSKYPADLFTCCMTTPIEMSVHWFILQVCNGSYVTSIHSINLTYSIPSVLS